MYLRNILGVIFRRTEETEPDHTFRNKAPVMMMAPGVRPGVTRLLLLYTWLALVLR